MSTPSSSSTLELMGQVRVVIHSTLVATEMGMGLSPIPEITSTSLRGVPRVPMRDSLNRLDER